MSEENQVQSTALSLIQEADANFQATVAKGSKNFLTRMSLAHPLADACLAGTVRPGEYFLGSKDKVRSLGNKFVALVGHYRYHAIVLQDKKVEAESFDLNDPVFKQIESEVVRKVKKENRRASFGIDFLLYLPKALNPLLQQDEFAVFYFKGSFKQEAPEALKRQGRMAQFTSKLIGDQNKWYVPVITDGPAEVSVVDPLLLQTTLSAFTVDRVAAEPEDEETRPR
jgi:hypothetical protein